TTTYLQYELWHKAMDHSDELHHPSAVFLVFMSYNLYLVFILKSFSYLLLIFVNIYKTILITKYIKAANNAEIGNVITQVTIIRCAVFHFTPLMRLEEPTPNIDEDTTCVVESGKCSDDATKIVKAEDKSAAAPLAGRIFIIFPPTVLIIFQPPTAVPNPIAVAQAILTHN